MGLAALVRAIEALGTVQVEMREAPDPRLYVEVCLLRLTRPEADDSTGALVERIENLERAIAELSELGRAAAPEVRSSRPVEAPPTAESRRSLGAMRREAAALRGSEEGDSAGGTEKAVEAREPETEKAADAPTAKAPPKANAPVPTRDEIVQAWGDGLLASLPQKPRARYKVGRFLEVEGAEAVFALPNEIHRTYCEEVKKDVEDALSERFGVRIRLRLVTDPEDGDDRGRGSGRADAGSERSVEVRTSEDDVEPDLLDPAVLEAETEPAGQGLSPTERLKIAFPGAEEV